MLRNIDLNEISDGKLYGINDMVKADCGGCHGCSACCHDMGTSIILDPLDVFRITTGLQKSFEELLDGFLELNVVDGIILPNLRMSGNDKACAFLDQNQRCSIHAIRPGICRIFPLGRFYQNHSFQYILQVHECPKPNKSKVKVRKWIDTEDSRRYEKYISDWHYYLKGLQEYIQTAKNDSEQKTISMYLLKQFFLLPFQTSQDFYEQFYSRLEEAMAYTDQFL